MQGDHLKRHHHPDLHAHEYRESKDCDGRSEWGGIWWLTRVPYATIADTPTADLEFERLVMASNINWFEGTEARYFQLEEQRWHDHSGCADDHDCHIDLADPEHPDPRGPEGCDCFPTVKRDVMEYGYSTDEGWTRGSVTICDNPDCRDESDYWQRDHTAEAAGY